MKSEKWKRDDGVKFHTLTLTPDEAAHVIARYGKFHPMGNVEHLARSFKGGANNGCWSKMEHEFQILIEEPTNVHQPEKKA